MVCTGVESFISRRTRHTSNGRPPEGLSRRAPPLREDRATRLSSLSL